MCIEASQNAENKPKSVSAKQLDTLRKGVESNEEFARTLLKGLPIGVCITDEQGTLVTANDAYFEIYGYEPDEMLGRNFTMVAPPEHRDLLTDLHNQFMGQTYEIDDEWEVITKNGERLRVLVAAAYLTLSSSGPQKMTFVVNISDHTRAEKLLERTLQMLADSLEMQEQALHAVLHDLRSPLSGIASAIALMKKEDLTEHQQRLVDVIDQLSHRSLRLTKSVTDMIHMEKGTYELQADRFDWRQLLDGVAEYMQLRFDGNGLRIKWAEESTQEPVPFVGDRFHLTRVIENLLINALDASSVDTVTMSLRAEGERVSIDIHNEGVIPERIRDSFFGKYVTAGKRNGTGFGTYYAQKVIELHGGRVSFDTSDDTGTTLHVVLPRPAEE
ncbi:MAG: PAS domain-containing sensor histidine kinase [Catalinimonas sp.]